MLWKGGLWKKGSPQTSSTAVGDIPLSVGTFGTHTIGTKAKLGSRTEKKRIS
jgi:hypothetical protein